MTDRALSEWKLLDAEPQVFSASAWHGVNIFIWHHATLDAVSRVSRAIELRRKDYADAISGVHIITDSVTPPNASIRSALIEVAHRWGDATLCIAAVVERSGMAGIALRSVVTGIIMLAPKHFRVKVFEAVDPCATWVAEQNLKLPDRSFEPADLLQVLKHARANAP